MITYLLALKLMAAQGILGAFDTLYHHELTEALTQHYSARKELAIHAARALIYSLLFIGLSYFQWHGLCSIALLVIFGIEIGLTLWDFVTEDQTRLLPASERVTHTILAMNGGAFIILLILNTPEWLAQPTALVWQPHGILGLFLALCGIGVACSGIRDGLAAHQIGKSMLKDQMIKVIRFGGKAESVLVTGATGFIGQNLVRALLADGQQVTVLTRFPKRAAWLFDGRVRCIYSMQQIPSDHLIHVIINLAGARILGWRWGAARKQVLRLSRIGITQNLVDWIASAEQKPRLFISASAIGYYGVQAIGDETELSENSPHRVVFMSQLCQDWENAARQASAYGVQVICMRFGLVLGHQGALPMMVLPVKLGLGGALGTGQQWVSWIHIHDVIRGIAHLWQVKDGGVRENTYNFVAPGAVVQKKFSQIAAQVLRRPCFIATPGLPLHLVLGEQSDLLLEGQRVIPRRLLADGFSFAYPDLYKALKNLL